MNFYLCKYAYFIYFNSLENFKLLGQKLLNLGLKLLVKAVTQAQKCFLSDPELVQSNAGNNMSGGYRSSICLFYGYLTLKAVRDCKTSIKSNTFDKCQKLIFFKKICFI